MAKISLVDQLSFITSSFITFGRAKVHSDDLPLARREQGWLAITAGNYGTGRGEFTPPRQGKPDIFLADIDSRGGGGADCGVGRKQCVYNHNTVD